MQVMSWRVIQIQEHTRQRVRPQGGVSLTRDGQQSGLPVFLGGVDGRGRDSALALFRAHHEQVEAATATQTK